MPRTIAVNNRLVTIDIEEDSISHLVYAGSFIVDGTTVRMEFASPVDSYLAEQELYRLARNFMGENQRQIQANHILSDYERRQRVHEEMMIADAQCRFWNNRELRRVPFTHHNPATSEEDPIGW
jgi:hypothetical protein